SDSARDIDSCESPVKAQSSTNTRQLARSVTPPTMALSRSVPLNLVDTAAEIQQADQLLCQITSGKLEEIAAQIRILQRRARDILEEAKTSNDLHRVECQFRKRPGHTYYLYCRQDGSQYFSMLSPSDWSNSPPDNHLGDYRLEADMSFTRLEGVGG
ncbi:MAG: DUF2452 domain-containing protein, partial [Polyangiaceae bacterium]|nr:DUF2452 domain-containing protein [Polyangiaceae bacterium]